VIRIALTSASSLISVFGRRLPETAVTVGAPVVAESLDRAHAEHLADQRQRIPALRPGLTMSAHLGLRGTESSSG
jgi:hypothetical protein